MRRKQIKDSWRDFEKTSILQSIKDMSFNDLSIVDGGLLDEVEDAFAGYFNKRYCVAFCNGTAAIHAAAYAALDKEGSIIAPKYSYTGAINALLENNIQVYIHDINPETLLLDLSLVDFSATKNLFLTSVWGASYDFKALKKHKVNYPESIIIMDNSHAYGTEWNDINISTFDFIDIACYSLGRRKFIDAGEFGIALTDNEAYAKRMVELAHPNRLLSSRLFEKRTLHNAIGNKYRPHIFALLLAKIQLKYLNEKLSLNKSNCTLIENYLSEIEGIERQSIPKELSRSYWKIPLRINLNKLKQPIDSIVHALEDAGIRVDNSFQYNDFENYATWNHSRHREYINLNGCPMHSLYSNWLLLPGYVDISKDDIEYICDQFKRILK